MTALSRGIAVAGLQCLIVLTTAGKYAMDRATLPRVWVKTAPYDPNLPLRGRYIAMRLEVGTTTGGMNYTPVRLSVRDGHLLATPDARLWASGNRILMSRTADRPATLADPVLFFLPEHAEDPSHRTAGGELWVEVSVPPKGPPRPIRLGVKRDDTLTPLPLD